MKKLLTCIFTMLLAFGFMTMPCKAEAATRTKYVDYNGVRLYTEAYNYSPNAKEAIIFLHGLGGNHSHAEFLYNESNPYMTISFDYLDHGLSGHVSNITWDNHLESIKAVLDAYGIEKAHVVGHSFGADTAMMFAKKYPGYVQDVELLDRAYFNFTDYEKFNITKDIMSTLEYDPTSGLSKDEFSQYVNMLWYNDITKTWDIDKDVLLLGGSGTNFIGLDEFIAYLKTNPYILGPDVDVNLIESFPVITENNITNLINFLLRKVEQFPNVNKRFSSIQTAYAHGDMVRDPAAMDAMRDYVLQYLANESKQQGYQNQDNQNQDKHSVYKYHFVH